MDNPKQNAAPLLALLSTWEARAAKALPADAMLVNKHVRELREALASEHGGGREAVALPSDTGPFADWLAREMPSGTVISNPAWWAPRILRQIARLTTQSAPVGLGVVDELLTNIKRSCVRGRNAADPTPQNSSFIAMFDHIEDLAQQAKRALSGVSAPVEDTATPAADGEKPEAPGYDDSRLARG